MKSYLLTEIVTQQGRINNTTIYRLTFVDLDTVRVFHLTVDTSYKNYTRSGWDRICDQRQFGVYTGLSTTNRTDTQGLPVLTADSRPEFVMPLSNRELAEVIEARLRELDPKTALFDFGQPK